MLVESLIATVGEVPAALLLILALLITFILLAIVCDEALAPALEELSSAWRIPHDVACATFLAAGSSAPELAISTVSVFHAKTKSVDLSLGAIMGSALIAFTVIPACSVLVSPDRELKLDAVPLARDTTFFGLGLYWLLKSAADATIDATESGVLLGMFLVYLITMKLLTPFYVHEDGEHHFLSRRHSSIIDDCENDIDTVSGYGTIKADGNNSKLNGTGPKLTSRKDDAEGTRRMEENPQSAKVSGDLPEQKTKLSFGSLVRSVIPPFNLDEDALKGRYGWILVVSIIYVSLLSEMALVFAEALSDVVGIPHHFVGLVLVALGAQVPDTVASMAVAKHGEGPSAISNAIGSQVLNINVGIGLPYLLASLSRGGVHLTPSVNSGQFVFGTVLIFVFVVVLEGLTLKMRDAVFLFGLYLSVLAISGFGLAGQEGSENNNNIGV